MAGFRILLGIQLENASTKDFTYICSKTNADAVLDWISREVILGL